MQVWEATIGLEVHARLLTKSKLFCGCSTEFGAPPNSHVCPVCLAYPGSLPVLNGKAVELAVRMALATECRVQLHSVFARKNYFYPDLPKGYQISQYDRPLALGGSIEILVGDRCNSVRIHRIHIEEDAGKLIHDASLPGISGTNSLVDLNRAGAPLIEIVSEPDIRTADEAVAYLTRLRQILMYTGVSDGNMEEGSLRCDANVSVHQPDAPLGTRTEVKNLNSFRFVGRAIEYEIDRQIAELERGGRIVQETRLYDPAAGETRPMRSKEEAHDYRYFPEPDLLPLRLEEVEVESIGQTLPPLPAARSERYQKEFGLSVQDAEALVTTRELADFFEETAVRSGNPRLAANWVRNEVLRVLHDTRLSLEQWPVDAGGLASLIALIQSESISGKQAKEVFEEMSATGEPPGAIVERRGMGQLNDPDVVRDAARRVIERHAAQVEQYRRGKTGIFGFLVGQVMKETGGKARPELANSILHEMVDG
ncbi:MAG: Asp-tRNA(Asn)/Glu-tRNA(Gln) amidotransferase subunit GatB [Acidobacteriota bacterium]